MSDLGIATASEWGSLGFIAKVKNGIPMESHN